MSVVSRTARGRVTAALTISVAGTLFIGCGADNVPEGDAGAPRLVLERAQERIRPPEESAGPVIYASGTLNQDAELQGVAPGETTPSSFREVLAVDGDRVGHEFEHRRVDGTSDHVREVYDESTKTIHVLSEGFSVRLVSGPEAVGGARVARRMPHRLIEDALSAADLAWAAAAGEGGELVLSFTEPGGVPLTLTLARTDSLPRTASYEATFPGVGDTRVTWSFEDYAAVGDVVFPRRYGVHVGEKTFIAMTVDSVVVDDGRLGSFLAGPAGHDPPIEVDPGDEPASAAEVETVGPGVHVVRGLRAGFDPMFVELDDFVLAVDAPAGYPLLLELPAGDVAPGPAPDWLSRRYLELIGATVPDKPVRYVVLTHFHNDHAGGVRAFVDAGATVIASPVAEAAIRAFHAAPHDGASDPISRTPRELSLELVDDRHSVGRGDRVVEIHAVPGNPHAEDMLVVHVPHADLLFESDLMSGMPADAVIERANEPVHAFFLRWLEGAALDPERILAMHGSEPIMRETRRRALSALDR